MNISFIGLIVTIIGAGVSIWQAILARKYTKKAKTYRDEVLMDRHKRTLFDLLSYSKLASEECKKIVKPVGKPMRGVDPQQAINILEGLYEKLNENMHNINNVEIQRLSTELRGNIHSYKQENTPASKYICAEHMQSNINSIISTLAELRDTAS